MSKGGDAVTTEARAIAIAKTALRESSRASDRLEFEAAHVKSVWVVQVWRIPRVPGGFTIVEVASDGKVLAIREGK